MTSDKLSSRKCAQAETVRHGEPGPTIVPIRRGEMLAVQRSVSSTSLRSGTERWTIYALGRAMDVTREGLVCAYEPAPGGRPVVVAPPGFGIHALSGPYQGPAADIFTECGAIPRDWATPDALRADLVRVRHKRIGTALEGDRE